MFDSPLKNDTHDKGTSSQLVLSS